ncbi:MAG: hypothetical protein KGZ87_06150 [Bacteroidetes bacterium]|nr:hypothetical protein [Bacteroidota bacterium]
MAKQKGIIKLKGTIGDITFYKTQDGHLAREKGGVDGQRIKTLHFSEPEKMALSLEEPVKPVSC